MQKSTGIGLALGAVTGLGLAGVVGGGIIGHFLGNHKKVSDNKKFLEELKTNPDMQNFIAKTYGVDTLQKLATMSPDDAAKFDGGKLINDMRDKWDGSLDKKISHDHGTNRHDSSTPATPLWQALQAGYAV